MNVTKLIWLGILAGLIIGPGYYLFTRYASGSVASEYVVYGFNKKLIPVERAWFSPVTVHLEPSMNPIAFEFVVSDSVVGDEFGVHSNTYAVSLADGDAMLWGIDWELGYRKIRRGFRTIIGNVYIPLYSNRLRVFSVSRAGDYTFTVEPQREGEIDLREMTLKVKAKVVQRNDGVMYAGIFLLGLSLVAGKLRLNALDGRW